MSTKHPAAGKITRWCCLAATMMVLSQGARGQVFTHPGALHTLADLNRMQTNVLAGNHPWIDDWNVLTTDSQAQSNYATHVQANMGSSRQNADLDAHAAYLNALRWYISGDVNYANKATNILNSWSAAVNQVPSGTDVPGLMGIAIAHFAEAGELLRIYPGWSAAGFEACTNMMVQYLYPSCNSFLTNHNGACISSYFANWDACNIEALLAMGVLCDNTNIYNQGVNYFKSGAGNGSISNAVPDLYSGGIGQEQESGRDQEHATLGLGELGAACQTAWNQGLDLFGFANNRLLAGVEYIAQYNLSHAVPYTDLNDCADDNMFFVANNSRGRLDDRPVYEMFYNHYAVLQGVRAPNTRAMAQLYRPDHGSADHFGYGTLAYTLNAAASPQPPAPLPPAPTSLTALAGIAQVTLNWTPPPGDLVQGYNVLRATTSGGPYTIIATWTAGNSPNTTPAYTDSGVVNGTTYYYVVSANNQSGTSATSAEAGATPAAAGSVPPAWTSQDVGVVTNAGSTLYAGAGNNSFIVTGYGTGIGGTADGGFHYTFLNATNNFTLVARLTANNADQMGLMLRAALTTNAALVQLMMAAYGRESAYGVRTPGGNLNHYTSGDQFTALPTWYKLTGSNNTFTAWQSADGVNWVNCQSSTFAMGSPYYAGIAINDGSATFDNVFYTNAAVTGSFAPPAAPANLTATAVTSNQVYLAWTVVTNAAGYNVLRANASGGPYTNLVTATPSISYYDTAAAAGTTGYYVVSAVNGGGVSTNSTPASVTTPAPSAPAPPAGLSVTPGTGQMALNWAASVGAVSYNVKRSTANGGPYTNVAAGVIATFADTNVAAGTRYFYVVSALNSVGESANSAQGSGILANRLTGTVIGTAGSWDNLGNTIANAFDGSLSTYFDGPDSTGDWAGLDFGAGVSNVVEMIEYCPRPNYASRMVGGVFQAANNPGFTSPVTLFTVTGTPASSVMTAQAVAVTNSFRYVRYLGPASANCDVAEIQFDGTPVLPPPPTTPAGLTATAGSGQVSLSWTVSSNATGYNVKRAPGSSGPFGTITVVTATNYTNTGLTNGTLYYFVVSATNAWGESANSTPVSARPLSPVATNLTCAAGSGQLQVNWPPDHTGWLLQAQTNSPGAGLGTNWVTVPVSAATNQMALPMDSTNGSVFLRLMHP